MKLTDPLQMLKGVGPKNAEALATLGLNTVGDLIDYWPRRYDDFSRALKIGKLTPGAVTTRGVFTNIVSRHSRRGLHVTEATLNDDTGSVKVIWFNQPYRGASLKPGQQFLVSGEFGLKAGRLNITNPRIEQASDEPETKGKILAIYKENKHVSSLLLRKVAEAALPWFGLVKETLPEWLIAEKELLSRADAVRELHMPASMQMLERAKDRLGFEEVFQMQLAGEYTRRVLAAEASPQIGFDEKLAREFVAHLPFALTPDQRRTIWQIYTDMNVDNTHVTNGDGVQGNGEQRTETYGEYGDGVAQSMTQQSAAKSIKPGCLAAGHGALVRSVRPMNRLVEGDVGSGKTVVAAMAALMVMNSGRQVLFMAPTEILARQHAESLAALFAHTQWADQVGLLIGALTPAQKKQLHARIADGSCRLVVGTHALIQDAVAGENVGLVVIDEQHRFGVDQRQKLRLKGGLYPHVLCMTATPIPRTLALSLYGEIDVTLLKSMPAGRTPIKTEVILPSAKAHMYAEIDKALDAGRQAFMVCPLIEENSDLKFTSAEELYEKLSKGPFKKRKLGLLHGRLKSEEKDAVMKAFAGGETELLIATTVIEVGVNVPNATVMVVESAERFGLAQIHQLRGRVGRGLHEGYCYLVPSDDQAVSRRLRVLETVTDGFRLSEIDLELRGPGAIYGVRQSGALDLRIASLTDEKLIKSAKNAAVNFVDRAEDLLHYTYLKERVDHFRSVSKLN